MNLVGLATALVLFACGSMALAGLLLLLLATDRRFLRSALIQAIPVLVAVVAVVAWYR